MASKLYSQVVNLLGLGSLVRFLSPIFRAVLIIAVLLAVYRWARARNQRFPYPPGPTPSLFIGNVKDFPAVRPWLTFTEWRKTYGDVIHLELLGQHYIVLNSLEAAKDLLEKRSSIYSDRPRYVLAEIMNFHTHTGLLPYGPTWRKHRSMFQHTIVRANGLHSLRPIHINKVKDLLANLLTAPDDFLEHTKTYAAAIILAAVYGHDIAPKNDIFVEMSEVVMNKVTEILVSKPSFVFNAFPLLRFIPSWFPGAGAKSTALRGRAEVEKMHGLPFEMVRNKMKAGVAPPSIVSNLLQNCTSEEDAAIIQDMAAGAYGDGISTSNLAATETTASTLGIFFYLMLIHPAVQEKAQRELDEIIGPDHQPGFEHRESLPYISAVLKEVLRYLPVGPLGVLHALSEDDVYKSYHMPKGAIVISNIWSINRDPSIFPEPEKFHPERFLNEDGSLRNDLEIWTFGFGRRICVGQYMASDVLWLAMASVLHAFNIKPRKDASGRDIIPEATYEESAVIHIHPFDCSITPRSKVYKDLIESTCLSKVGDVSV